MTSRGSARSFPLGRSKMRNPPILKGLFNRRRSGGSILKGIIENELTQRQRSVLVAHVFQGMPLDLVADWLGTSRDTVYKILHDARKKLKKCLIEHGLTQEEILGVFEGTA